MNDRIRPEVASRPRQSFPPGATWLVVLGIVGVLILASAISVLPTFKTQPAGTTVAGSNGNGGNGGNGDSGTGTTGSNGGNGDSGTGTTGSNGANGSGPAANASAAANPSQYQCAAGKNGGPTDVGVSGSAIKLASTVAESGIGQSFLGEVRYGMIAVVNQVNSSGGICGRKLKLTLVDDAWNPTQGASDIRSFIADNVFAMPVVPSSEGLNQSHNAGDIDRAGIPVVGTDGMLNSQYSDPWIWPVSTSTSSTAHIAVYSAYKAGARTFGIAYDKDYKFGPEGEKAFAGAIHRLSGAQLLASVPVSSGQTDYSSDGSTFNNGCKDGCDMVFILMDPSTAETWFATSGAKTGTKFTEGPQPLFVTTFGQNCGAPCNNMIVWTSYYPPLPPFNGYPDVANYINAIRSVSPSADVKNQFLEGGYDGMLLFIQALKKVGPNLTRAGLRAALNSMTFDSHLSQPLSWSEGNHYANTSMLGFSIQYSQGFNGFQYQRTDWVKDPWSQADH